MKTIAIDFDGVIHKYSKGWQNGEIYDEPNEMAFDYISQLIKDGYSVFILSSRSPRQICRWMNGYLLTHDMYYDSIFSLYGFTVEVIPFWKKFWNKKGVVGVTNKKLPAEVYIDDRAFRFLSFKELPPNY
jgi:hypothetical protein